MRVVKLIGAALAALYALACLVRLLSIVPAVLGNTSPYGAGALLGGLAGALLGAAIALALWKSAAKDVD